MIYFFICFYFVYIQKNDIFTWPESAEYAFFYSAVNIIHTWNFVRVSNDCRQYSQVGNGVGNGDDWPLYVVGWIISWYTVSGNRVCDKANDLLFVGRPILLSVVRVAAIFFFFFFKFLPRSFFFCQLFLVVASSRFCCFVLF